MMSITLVHQFTSKYLANTLNMRAPYEQYGLYISGVSALAVAAWQARRGVRAMGRARELGRAADLKEQGQTEGGVDEPRC